MPDVVLHYTAKNWLLLVESVTSNGPVDGKRHAELAALFGRCLSKIPPLFWFFGFFSPFTSCLF